MVDLALQGDLNVLIDVLIAGGKPMEVYPCCPPGYLRREKLSTLELFVLGIKNIGWEHPSKKHSPLILNSFF